MVIAEGFVYTDPDELTNLASIFFFAFFCVALIEEGFKYLVFRHQAKKCPHFNQMYEAIVYSVFISLGFATAENILYVMSMGAKTGILRAVTAVPGYAIFGVTMGYYMGLATFTQDKKKQKKYRMLSIGMPIFLHGLYDFLVMSKYPLLVLLFFPFMVYLYVSGIKKTKTLTKMDFYQKRLEDQRFYQEMNDKRYCNYVPSHQDNHYVLNHPNNPYMSNHPNNHALNYLNHYVSNHQAYSSSQAYSPRQSRDNYDLLNHPDDFHARKR